MANELYWTYRASTPTPAIQQALAAGAAFRQLRKASP